MNRTRFAIALGLLAALTIGCAGTTSPGDAPIPGTSPPDGPPPRITITEPAEDAVVSGTITVAGEASVFEGTVVLRLRDPDGNVASSTFATATEGAPGRGTWSTEIQMPSGPAGTWTIEAVEESAEDGSDAFVTTRRVQVA